MMVELIDRKNNILRNSAQKFNFSNPQIDPVVLYNDLGKMMLEKNGLGLSAPQIGFPYRVFVIRSDPVIPFFNPIIVDKSEDVLDLEEGCLTYPNLLLKIKRPQVIKVRFADPKGEYQTRIFQDYTARVIQHEVDHLDGILFGVHCGEMKLKMAVKKGKKFGSNYMMKELI